MEYILYGTTSVEITEIENFIASQGEIKGLIDDIAGKLNLMNVYGESFGIGFLSIVKTAFAAIIKFIGAFKFIISAVIGGIIAMIKSRKLWGRTIDVVGHEGGNISMSNIDSYGKSGIQIDRMAEDARRSPDKRTASQMLSSRFVEEFYKHQDIDRLTEEVQKDLDPAFTHQLVKDTLGASIKNDGPKGGLNKLLRIHVDNSIECAQIFGNDLIFQMIKVGLDGALTVDNPLISDMRKKIQQYGPLLFLKGGAKLKSATNSICRLYNAPVTELPSIMSSTMAESPTLLAGSLMPLGIAGGVLTHYYEEAPKDISDFNSRLDRRAKALQRAIDKSKEGSYTRKMEKALENLEVKWSDADLNSMQEDAFKDLYESLTIGHTKYNVSRINDYRSVLDHFNELNDLFVEVHNPMDLKTKLTQITSNNNISTTLLELAPKKDFDDYIEGNKLMRDIVRSLREVQDRSQIDLNDIRKTCDKLLIVTKDVSNQVNKIKSVSDDIGFAKVIVANSNTMISLILAMSNIFLKITKMHNHPAFNTITEVISVMASDLALTGLENIANRNESR